MCGISGIIFKQEAPDWSILMAMLEHQFQRGPDATGTWIDGKVGFAHNRLSIIDTSKNGNQPMETDRWVLIFNGEIYGYNELRSLISVRQWKSYNDAETLLFLIDERGIEATLDIVEGMFSFAAYDKSKKELWLAVDPMGIKPLYFYHDERMFSFASTPGALTHCKDAWEMSRTAIDDFLALGATRESFFSGIKKLMPGTILHRQEDGKTGIKKYYKQINYAEINENDLIEAVEKSIQSVKVSDVPVSLFLSGGIDSTVIASNCQFMNAIHLDSPEKEFAERVAKKYDLRLQVISPSDYSAKKCLEDYALKSGDCSMSSIIPYMVSKEVSKFCKVAISANGADELFFGYDRINAVPTWQQRNHIFRGPLTDTTWPHHHSYHDPRNYELDTYVQFDLNKTLDFASMCHGLEVRVPFLNRKVVDMAMSLPMGKHVRGYRRKVILKDYLQKKGFDTPFLDRPKLGFSLFKEPYGYNELKIMGVEFLKESLGINPKLETGRDRKYYEASAAALFCWFSVWRKKITAI